MNGIRRSGWQRVLGGLLCLGAVSGLSGCVSLPGHWAGAELPPETARDQFTPPRPTDQSGKFVSADVRLQDDGSYTAEPIYDGRIEQSLSTWKPDARGHLTFVDKQGRSCGYTARRPNGHTSASWSRASTAPTRS